jgi:alkylresorcinol/alkylpyrone synthase
MRLLSAATAFPANTYPQRAITEALLLQWGQKLSSPDLLTRLHSRCGVEQRHMVLKLPEYARIRTFGEANNIWIDAATRLGSQAICRALQRADLAPPSISAIFFTTVTGLASPSIDARLINQLPFREDVKRIPIFGLGCVAGAAAIARAADYVRAYPDQYALVLSAELCSLTWQRDDVSSANLVATGLFGDGAAAVIIGGLDTVDATPRILGSRSIFYRDTEDAMGWDISETGFRIILSPALPQFVHQNLRHHVDSFLETYELQRKDISSWIFHSGGPRILDAVESALELSPDALAVSRSSLREVGNLSSASVLAVLNEYLNNKRGATGSYSVLAAMGPGFCAELVLLQW